MSGPLEALTRIIDEWAARPPVLVALWFVDAPHERRALAERLRGCYQPTLWQTFQPNIAGIPVYEFETRYASDDEWQTWPWVILWPGVWLKFSDGSWRQLERP